MHHNLTAANDALACHPILRQARQVLTDPDLARAAGPIARQLAWYIESNARGRTPRQCHRPANTSGRSR